MDARTTTRGARRTFVAALVTLAGAGPGAAQVPQAAPPSFPAAGVRTIEVYHGVTRVSPAAPDFAPQAAPEPAPLPAERPRPSLSLVEAMNAVREDTKAAPAPARPETVSAPAVITPPPQPVIPAAYSAPAAASHLSDTPWFGGPARFPLASSTAPAAAPQPTVVVIREPAAVTPAATEPARAPVVGLDTLVTFAALGFGAVAAVFGCLAWVRTFRKSVAPPAPVVAAPPAEPDDPNVVKLMGKYNAGPVPDTAERFDIGPSYQDDQQQKKAAVEGANTAAVEFILNQNIALLALLDPAAEAAHLPLAEVIPDPVEGANPETLPEADEFLIPVDDAAPAVA